MDPFTLTFIYLAGVATGVAVAAFWDDIKEWAKRAIRSILNAIDQAIQVVSDAIIFLSRKGGRIYKEVEIFSRNIYNGAMKKNTYQTEASEYSIAISRVVRDTREVRNCEENASLLRRLSRENHQGVRTRIAITTRASTSL